MAEKTYSVTIKGTFDLPLSPGESLSPLLESIERVLRIELKDSYGARNVNVTLPLAVEVKS